MRRVMLVLLLAAGGCGGEEQAVPHEGLSLDDYFVAETTSRYVAATGDVLGRPAKARFTGDGSHVVVLDQYSPHLKLFGVDGAPLWSGADAGGGPRELESPTELVVIADTVVAVQQGRLSRWLFDTDSLAFLGSEPIPPWKVPIGAAFDCVGDLLLYGVRLGEFLLDRESPDGSAKVLSWLHVVERDSAGVLRYRAVWTQPRDPGGAAALGSTGALLGRGSAGLVLLHRTHPTGEGEYIEFDCSYNIVRRQAEGPFHSGDTLTVLEPRPNVLDWTNGVIGLGDGYLAAVGRHSSENMRQAGTTELPAGWWTELFLVKRGVLLDSVVIPRQWFLMDYHPSRGALMTALEPVPHFIIIPPDRLGVRGLAVGADDAQ